MIEAPARTARNVTSHSTFDDRLRQAMRRTDSLLCVGLDPDPARMPRHLRHLDPGEALVRFNTAIIAATRDLVCAYKPNLGFYVGYGLPGIEALIETRRLIPAEIPVILDCKVGDMDNTAAAYARGYFDEWGFDAVTVNPYMGEDSLIPFFSHADRGVLVICKTSNPGSGDFQDMRLAGEEEDEPLFLALARKAARWSTSNPATVGLVVGATYPAQLAAVRARCSDLPILLPGVGAQAGDLDASVAAGIDAAGEGLIVSASRAVIYAGDGPDFAEWTRAAAVSLRDQINAVRRV